VSHLWAV